MSFHTSKQLDQRSRDQQQSQVSKFCSGLTHQFGLLQCGPASHTVGGRFEKPGHGDDTAAGGATRVSTGTTELGAFGEAEGGEERCEEPNMPRHMKGLVDHSL